MLPLAATCILYLPIKSFANGTSMHGGREATVTVTEMSQTLSGIATRRLKPALHKAMVKAFGEVVDLGSFIDLRTSYLTAEAAARKAEYQLAVSRNEYYRTLNLFHSSKYVSVEKLQNAEAAYNSDLADSAAAHEKISNIRSVLIQNWGRVISGWVTRHSVKAKALADGQLSLILITISAESPSARAPGSAEVVNASGKVLVCRLVSASPKSNHTIQGVNYFYSVASTPSLPEGLNIVARLPVGKAASGVVVPSSSVVWWHGKAWAYVETKSGSFSRRPVNTAEPFGSGWFVSGGIRPGDRIVIRGAQLLLSQEFKSEALGNDD